MTADTRNKRDDDKREITHRKKTWAPASILPDPTPIDGWTFKYIRKAVMGEQDPVNVSKSIREGWEPCQLENHPELQLAVDNEAKTSGLVEIGGLILCKMPSELFQSREEYFANIGNEQVRAMENQAMSAQDPRMATMFNERKSNVTFGSGR